jgi:hypothetical protein
MAQPPCWIVNEPTLDEKWRVVRMDGVSCVIEVTPSRESDTRTEERARALAAALNRVYGSTKPV